MPNVNDMFPSKWLKAGDCTDGDLTLTISAIRQESIGQGQKQEDKWVLFFEEDDKGLVLNKTNTNSIVKLYGDSTDDWVGKPITLFSCEVQFGNDMVEAIRVRNKAPKKPQQAARPAQAQQQPQRGNGNGNGNGGTNRGQAPAQQQQRRAPVQQQVDPDEDIDLDDSVPF